jgi:ComF family protein
MSLAATSPAVPIHAARRPGLPARLGARLLDLAFPPACAGCQREGDALCPACLPALDARAGVAPGVALGLPSPAPPPLLQLEWCAPYAGVVRAAVRGLKYGGERRLAPILGEAIARRWAAAGCGGELLVPVPVHASRRRDRGFDQAVLIATAASAWLGTPIAEALVRTRATARQFDLDRADRAANVSGAFTVPPPARHLISGRWVVLVDDVATTGATLTSCAEALLAVGAGAVSAVTVGREL